jgi:DDE superfamily endonuclease
LIDILQEDGGERPLKYWSQDETRLGLQTTMGKRITLTGVKPLQPVQWPREAIWLYGVVAPATGESFFYEFSHLDTACFEMFLELLSAEYPDVLNVIQLDQAPAHSSQKLQIPENIVLLYQPSHSPELNPIERVWEDLKIDFKGENYANLDELRAAIRETLGYMTPEWIASLTQYPYIMKALSVSIIN